MARRRDRSRRTGAVTTSASHRAKSATPLANPGNVEFETRERRCLPNHDKDVSMAGLRRLGIPAAPSATTTSDVAPRCDRKGIAARPVPPASRRPDRPTRAHSARDRACRSAVARAGGRTHIGGRSSGTVSASPADWYPWLDRIKRDEVQNETVDHRQFLLDQGMGRPGHDGELGAGDRLLERDGVFPRHGVVVGRDDECGCRDRREVGGLHGRLLAPHPEHSLREDGKMRRTVR